MLREALLVSVQAAQAKLAPAAPASVTDLSEEQTAGVIAWAVQLEARARLEGALAAMELLQEAWAEAPMLLGQLPLIRQQLREPPPGPPSDVSAQDAAVADAVDALCKFARSSGSAALIDSFQAQRYDELLYKLSLQRQEALKISLRLEFCHQLRGMRKRHALINICKREAEALAAFVPITVHRACVKLILRCDDWRSADGSSPTLDNGLDRVYCDEVRDWYGVPSDLDLAAAVESADGNRLLVRLEVFEKRRTRTKRRQKASLIGSAMAVEVGGIDEGDEEEQLSSGDGAEEDDEDEDEEDEEGRVVVPSSNPVMARINELLDQIMETPPNVERGRHPELAELLGCTYIGVEVLEKHEARTEVHAEPTLAERIAEARASFAKAQLELDKMGASNRTQKWANMRKWNFIEGAVAWLKGESTAELSNALSSSVASEIELPKAKAALETKTASRMRWEAVKQQIKVKAEQDHAATLKKRKGAVVAVQQQAAASELLASMLLEASYACLTDLPWRSEGEIDIKWNLGLVPLGGGGGGGGGEAEEEEQEEETRGQRRWR